MSCNSYLTSTERLILESATIGIAGAGGLGSNCAMHLVRAGIKNLVIVDFDVVNESNLNRQFYFRDQIGQVKVEALKENLLRIEPELELEIHNLRLNAENIQSIFGKCDILAEAFDHADAKNMLIKAAAPLHIPIVAVSGIAGWGNSEAIKIRQIGKQLTLIGDLSSEVSTTCSPVSPRVGIAAAMQANSIIAKLLKYPMTHAK